MTTPTPDRWREISRIFDAAVQRDRAARDAFVERECGADPWLKPEVERLLAAHDAMSSEAAGVGGVQAVRLTPGSHIGVFRIESILGVGGMGEVYRARDTKLNRDVALKIVPDAYALDADRLLRLRREAQVLASLNHPNIGQIYGLEETGRSPALVLELVEGPTLFDMLARGPLTWADAAPIALQITAALEAAHDSGIVHRDLKPSNIKVRGDGTVRVLDFGLAKPFVAARSDPHDSTTVYGAVSEVGLIVGTPAYMAPEQRRGLAVDRRADIWAFGAVLYEMLTGRRAFDGGSAGEAGVTSQEVDWNALPSSVPAPARSLLARCLERDVKRRLRDIGEARILLTDVMAGHAEAAVTPAARAGSPARSRYGVLVGVVLLLAVGAGGFMLARFWSTPEEKKVRFGINSLPTRFPDSLAMSIDGRWLAFPATVDGRSQLWLHSVEDDSAQPLPGTEDARTPFWSPNGQSIGFFAQGMLKRIDIQSGTVLPLTDAPNSVGGAWIDDDTIVFVSATRLLRITSGGGAVSPVPSTLGVGPAERPILLPGTRRLLFSTRGPSAGLYVSEIDGPKRWRIGDRTVATATADTLLYINDATLFARRFDPSTPELTGTPTKVASDVLAVSATPDGSIAYRSGTELSEELTWFDRSGKEIGRAGKPGISPALSSDGNRVAMMRERERQPWVTEPGVWIWDRLRGSFDSLVLSPPVANTPVWSPDDSRIVYSSARDGQPFALYERPSDGGGSERQLLQTNQAIFANDWRDDVLIYRSSDPKTGFDLWTLSVDDLRSKVLLRTAANEREAQMSPDGRWFAYQSDETNQYEIYIRSVPEPDRARYGAISIDGGTQVRWNRNGRELFYLSLDNYLVSVRITQTSDGAIEADKPVQLFKTRAAEAGVLAHQYAVSPNAERFLILSTREVTAPVKVILKWSAER